MTLCGHLHKRIAEGLAARIGRITKLRGRTPGAGLHHGSRTPDTTTLLVLFESGTRLSGSTTAITCCPITSDLPKVLLILRFTAPPGAICFVILEDPKSLVLVVPSGER